MAAHVALLGDSIFDNGAYTNGLPDVGSHLRAIVKDRAIVTMLAVDGTTTGDLSRQVGRLPVGVTHAAVSLGGNDALLDTDALDLPVASTADALRIFAERSARFATRYRAAIQAVVDRVPTVAICTIYNPDLPIEEAELTRVGLALFNDVILRFATESRLAVIDLRTVIVGKDDLANALEPSSAGAAKIAMTVARALGLLPETGPTSTIFMAEGG